MLLSLYADKLLTLIPVLASIELLKVNDSVIVLVTIIMMKTIITI